MGHSSNAFRAKVAARLCLGLGKRAWAVGVRPDIDLQLFEFESCPYCRKVRVTLCALDIPVTIFPCPRKGQVYRPSLASYGKIQVPFLIDPNRDYQSYESNLIVQYLFANYGNQIAPLVYHSDISIPLGSLASVLRFPAGVHARSAKQPEQLIELFATENSSSCLRVRELLCELEIAYRLVPVAPGSEHHKLLQRRSGQDLYPWLIDVNTSSDWIGADRICAYLIRTYAS